VILRHEPRVKAGFYTVHFPVFEVTGHPTPGCKHRQHLRLDVTMLEPKAIENCDHEKLVRTEEEPRIIGDGTPFVAAKCVQCGGRGIFPDHETSPGGPLPIHGGDD